MDGLFQENGPFQWQSGTYAPQPNPFSWTNLTNMVWIDQPIGTGLSLAAPGAPAQIKDETDVARGFAGFWKNFIETFEMQGFDVYFTGKYSIQFSSPRFRDTLTPDNRRIIRRPVHSLHIQLLPRPKRHNLLQRQRHPNQRPIHRLRIGARKCASSSVPKLLQQHSQPQRVLRDRHQQTRRCMWLHGFYGVGPDLSTGW